MPKWREWEETVEGRPVKFYRVRGTPEGRETQRIFRSDKHRAAKTQAKALHDEWERAEKQRRGEEVPDLPMNAGPKVSFREAAQRYLDTRSALKREQATQHDYRAMIDNHLAPWFEARGRVDVRRITVHDVVALRDDLASGRFLQTRGGRFLGQPIGIVGSRKMLALVKSVLGQAVADGYIKAAPGQEVFIETPSTLRTKVARDRQERVWQWTEVFSLLRAADRLAVDPDARRRKAWITYRPLAYFILTTGVRVSEALAIRFRNLDLDAGVARVEAGIDRYRREGPGKNASAFREIVLHRGLVSVLRGYIKDAGLEDADPASFLFPTAKGEPLSPRTVHQRCWSVLVDEANRTASDPARADPDLVKIDADGVAWHGARRFINSLMVGSDVQREALRRFMGHSGEDMTARYSYDLKGKRSLDDLFRPEDLPPLHDPSR